MRINPFFELYVGDRLSSREFVNIFSPYLVKHATAIFLPGNVVVKGIQGSGKSMLLSLLRPEVRLEYAKANSHFPIPSDSPTFIGAGINLAHSNAIDFGYRSISADHRNAGLLFGDFVNYTVVLDLLDSFQMLANARTADHGVPIKSSDDRQREFVAMIRETNIFRQTLNGCTNVAQVKARILHRLNSYRRFLHMNDQNLDEAIVQTKTNVGEPISAVCKMLKRSRLVSGSVNFLIHIDQYEELANISRIDQHSPDYRSVINRALARRDPAVSYRIGTRGHAWRNHGKIFGVSAKLEEERDYKFVDLDAILRRSENRSTWVFPGFAQDVFARRLRHVQLASVQKNGAQLMRQTFGKAMSPEHKAKLYAGSNPIRCVRLDKNWPQEFRAAIKQLAKDNPLLARLTEAWVLQKEARRGRLGDLNSRLVPNIGLKDEMVRKKWWIKERKALALVQIAGRCQQRVIWSGDSEVIDLSGGNILTFLSICQFIWDAHNQLRQNSFSSTVPIDIEPNLQTLGIFRASEYWLQKIRQETGRGGDRFRLVRHIGNTLSRKLYADKLLSYPGHNGFSLADEDLDTCPHVRELLEEMSDYGTILAYMHTTKLRDRRSRTKYYLRPILCPHFRIHYQRLKEPLYIDTRKVESWMHVARVPLGTSNHGNVISSRPSVRFHQMNLPLIDQGDGT